MTQENGARPHDGELPSYPICGKPKRDGSGEPCTQPAGWGTDHVGVGPCKLHGGASPIKHGRYSKLRREALRDLIAQYEQDPDPLNLLPELATARALLQDFLDRNAADPDHQLDVEAAGKLLTDIANIVARIERIRSANAISRPELYRIMGEMGRVVERWIGEENMDADEKLSRIKDGWLAIRV